MIMPPSLKGSSRIISVFAVDLYELVEYTSSEIKILIAEMFTQDQEYLMLLLIRRSKR